MVRSRTWHILGTFLVLVAVQKRAEAVNCFVCSSYDDASCSDGPLSLVPKKNCSEVYPKEKFTSCRKIVQVLEFEHASAGASGPDRRVIRECDPGDVDNKYAGKCYHRSGFGGNQDVCTCFDDLCNSAPRKFSAISELALLVFAAVPILLR